jgi:mRNA-degrading endonuclease YafQ of YafQ-DinJ toxin-antitoxin module
LPEYEYSSLDFTETFLETYASRDFSKADRSQFRKALRLLDQNEKHPSLRVHPLQGDRDGAWAASASDVLRLTFERLPDGRKRMLTCSRHYDR